MEEDIIIGDRIRKIREDLKMSRETFSEMIDISDFFLGKIERGERSLSNNTLIKIVKFTGVSADYILFGRISIENDLAPINKDFNALSKENYSLLEEIIKVMLKTQNNK